jgi:hypothetical protein
VRVVSSKGREARGRLAVDGDRIVFTPAPVLAHDLSDGGYLPGTTYFVELAGFPRPDGLRGASGVALQRNLRWEFRTVDLGGAQHVLFEDPSPERGSVVVLETTSLRPLQPIRLKCPEALDPSTLYSEDFTLDSRSEKAIPLVARLLANDEGGALIELRARDRVLAAGSYQLQPSEDVRLRDLGHHPLLYQVRRPLRIEPGVAPDAGAPTQHVESFTDERTRSPEAIDGVDGTAYWGRSDDPEGRTGKVEVRWPAAAGLGAEGEVSLGAALDSTTCTRCGSRSRPRSRATSRASPVRSCCAAKAASDSRARCAARRECLQRRRARPSIASMRCARSGRAAA